MKLNGQKKYIKKQIELGMCKTCGSKKAFKWDLCRSHYKAKVEYQRQYQEENRKEQRERCRLWRLKNPKYAKKYYQKNKKEQ